MKKQLEILRKFSWNINFLNHFRKIGYFMTTRDGYINILVDIESILPNQNRKLDSVLFLRGKGRCRINSLDYFYKGEITFLYNFLYSLRNKNGITKLNKDLAGERYSEETDVKTLFKMSWL
ncbi:hypothetical protein Anas_10102 [Armadillidium nasatum]|uniref:Uncharacterized protein n=1 Tax=Armadillidium nasatum TaxID=96803 RepID=A0A5N5TMT9_9CRUS|nr:hypothetical protein Anas_10102 [Armadillidium nasatum]